MELLEKCQSAFDSTFSSKGKVLQRNKEANNFYHKFLKRMTRVKSTVVAEVKRIEEIMRNLPKKQQADLAKAVATRKTKYNKRKYTRKNKRDALKKMKIENSPDSQEDGAHTECEVISKPSEKPSKQQDETATVSVDQSSDTTSEDDYGKNLDGQTVMITVFFLFQQQLMHFTRALAMMMMHHYHHCLLMNTCKQLLFKSILTCAP